MSFIRAAAPLSRVPRAVSALASPWAGDRAARMIWAVIATLAFAVAVAFPLAGLRLTGRDILLNGTLAAAMLAASAVYAGPRAEPRLARLFRAVAELVLITYLGGALTYAATAAAMPLQDAAYHAMDRAIGFDWPALARWQDERPLLHHLLVAAYHSMLFQMAIVLVALATLRRFREADLFILAFALAAIATTAVAALAPALCAGFHYAETVAALRNIAIEWDSIPQVMALREGTMTQVSLQTATGLITFPSFHAVAASLFIIGFWRAAWLRWPAFALNLGMLAATPIIGGHYIVDVIAGVALAFAARRGALAMIAERPIRP